MAKKKTTTKGKRYGTGVTKRSASSKVIYKKKRQTGTSNKMYDVLIKAMPPGKRQVKGSKPYYEYRKNRTDAKGLTGIGSLPTFSDPHAVRELDLFMNNESDLYSAYKLPIIKSLERKYHKGTFDIEKSAKAWKPFIEAGIKKYQKLFGNKNQSWSKILSVSDRKLLAHSFSKDILREFKLGNSWL